LYTVEFLAKYLYFFQNQRFSYFLAIIHLENTASNIGDGSVDGTDLL